jgi:putative addiction module component (TIGR02574 family)
VSGAGDEAVRRLLVLDFEMAVVEWRRLQQRAGKATLSRVIKETIPELQTLSPAEKFALAIELWDELASNPDEIPVTDEQLNELDRRFEEYQRNPEKVVTWENVKARILSTGK